MKNIGYRLKEIRKTKNLTQQELGTVLSVSKQAIANIESGHNNPSIEFISKLIENLDINSNWFISGKGNMFNAAEFNAVKSELRAEVMQILKEEGII